MKAVPAWVYFSVLRVLMFVVPLVVLLVLGIEPWISTLLAAVIGLCLSYIFLRKPRESVALDLYAARNRGSAPATSDDATEDAAIDAAVERAERDRAMTARVTPNSEGERQSEQEPVAETGEAGELQRKNKLP
jgi:hypothetical protein